MSGKRPAVLLIDDNRHTLEVVSQVLATAKLDVTAVDSGKEALDHLASDRIDLVLVDLLMPEMDGLEVIRHIRANHPNNVPGIVVLSAVDESAKMVEALDLGAQDYVTKPINFPVLLARIRSLLAQQQREEQLTEREQSLSVILANIVESIIVIGADGHIQSFNEAAERMFGYAADEVLGENVSMLMPEPDRSRHDGYIEEYLRTGKGKIIDIGFREVTLQRKDGSTFTGELAVSALIRRGKRSFIGTMRDITDRKRAEEALSLSQERLSSAITSLREGFALYDADDRLVAFNDEFASLNPLAGEIMARGGTFEDLIRAHLGCGVIVEAEGHEETFIQERLLQHCKPTGPIVRRRSDGNWYMIEESPTPEGGIATTFTNITELKEKEAQLVQSAKLATLGQMASGIAHELNQPLNVVRMASEYVLLQIEEGTMDADVLSKKLSQIESQADRMAKIIDHMRVFARQDREPRGTLQPIMCIENALTLIEQQFGADGIVLAKDLPDACGSIKGSAVQLEQVILNLLSNARDVIAEGGAAMGAAGKRDTGRVGIELVDSPESDTITISILDNGGGIADDVRQHIFDPFYTTKDEGAGTGLGLSISYKIIESMGGQLDAIDINGGTRFEIALPRIADATSGGNSSRKARSAEASKDSRYRRRVLVVDDERLAAANLADYLERRGFEVTIAGDGAEALTLYRAQPADAVITDLRMPTMNGRELIRLLRESNTHIPIFVVTGDAKVGSELEIVAEGATVVMKKPISLSNVTTMLEEAMSA